MPPIVQITNVVKEYPLGKLVVRALRGVDLTIEKGEFTAIAGPSGSGKTTLLNLIGCVDVPTTGDVIVDGHATAKLDDKALTKLRLHHIGFIFQSFNLINVLDVFQNVEFPLLLQGTASPAERKARVEALIIALMRELNQTQKTTFIFSTHDSMVMTAAQRIVRIADGKVVTEGAAG